MMKLLGQVPVESLVIHSSSYYTIQYMEDGVSFAKGIGRAVVGKFGM